MKIINGIIWQILKNHGNIANIWLTDQTTKHPLRSNSEPWKPRKYKTISAGALSYLIIKKVCIPIVLPAKNLMQRWTLNGLPEPPSLVLGTK